MIVLFRNNRGSLEILSPQRVRDELSLAVNSGVEQVEAVEAGDNPNLALSSVLSKLGVENVEVGSEDVRDAIVSAGISDDRIGVIFSMSRPHFLALVYLLYSGGADASSIGRIVDLDTRSRTEVLLEMVSGDSAESIVSVAFDSAINRFFHSPAERPAETLDLEYFKPDDSSSTVVDLAVSMVPDVFFTVQSLYREKVYGITDGSTPADWPMDAISGSWVCGGKYCSTTSARSRSFLSTFYSNWAASSPKRFPDYYQHLTNVSEYKDYSKQVSTTRLHSFMLNSYLPFLSIRTFRLRESNRRDESSAFDSNKARYISAALRRGSIYATSLTSYVPSYFTLAYWVYSDEEDISSTTKDLGYWESFLKDSSPGDALRDAEAASTTAAGDFSYVDDEGVAGFLKELFPVSALASERTSESYAPSYFLTRRGYFSIYPGATQTYFTTNPSLLAYDRKARARAQQLAAFDMLAKDDGTVVSMGPLSVREFASTALKIALAKVGYSDSDVVALASYSQASSYFSGLKASVTQAILDQAKDPSSGADYNYLISDSNANHLNRVFVADVVGQFFDYLLDNEQDEFVPVLSEESMSTYRLLNFLKHTIINFGSFMDSLEFNQYYREFVYMVAIARGGLNKDVSYSAFSNRSSTITISDIKDVAYPGSWDRILG